jgi:hypothetical protein
MLDLGKLATLKALLVEATDFGDVYDYFMDHFGASLEIVKAGEPYHDAVFVAALERIGGAVAGDRSARLTQPFLLRIPEQGFIHGVFAIGDRIGSVFYFEDIEKGLLGFGASDSEGPSELARFTLAAVPDGGSSMLN